MLRRSVCVCLALVALTPLLSGQGCVPPSGVNVGAGGGAPQALVGIWQTSFVDPVFGPASVELILMQNQRFQQQTFYQAGSLVTIFGTYRVFPTEALLRLDIERGEPSQFCALECTPILYPAGESHGYTLADNNTLVLRNVNCVEGTGAVCTLTYGRAG